MKYLFDSNIFIRSKNEMPIDLWPTFWTRVIELIHGGQIFTSIKVKEEIYHGDDELTRWMKENAPEYFYITLDSEILQKYEETQNWAERCQRFKQEAKNEYATVADAYLVATAAAKGMTIVSYEVSDPTCRKRVKIPDACNASGVSYCDLNTALRCLGVKI